MKTFKQYLQEKENVKTVVIYGGRFQPFHKAHYETFLNVKKTFKDADVYIATSDKVDPKKSPFNFDEKKEIMTKVFGIKPKEIGQVKNAYNPQEIISKYPEDTKLILVVGKKDAERLKTGKFVLPYESNKDSMTGYKEHSYYWIAPENKVSMSGTEVRNNFSSDIDEAKRKQFFKKVYGKFDQAIYDLIISKINSLNESYLITEGGAFGHLSNVYEKKDFDFNRLFDIIKDSLAGDLDYVRLKTDGQNLSFTVIDGELRFARNKGHLKNFGETSMTKEEFKRKFDNRGGLTTAYHQAADEIVLALSKLPKAKLLDLFENGKKFMSMEVMHTDSENVVHYGSNQLRFHGTRTYDVDGNIVGESPDDGVKLFEMLKQIRQDKQSVYKIHSLEKVDLPKIPNFKERVKYYMDRVKKEIMKPYGMKATNTINDYFVAGLTKVLDKKKIPYNENLIDRFVSQSKAYNAKLIKADFGPDNYKVIMDFEKKELAKVYKSLAIPMEKIFLMFGAEILSNVSNFMVLDKKKSTEAIKKKLDDAIDKVKKANDPRLLDRLAVELDRLQSVQAEIFPEEGITFFHKGEFLKFTGAFAPTNQILGLTYSL